MARPGRHNGFRSGFGEGHLARSTSCVGSVRQLWVRAGTPPRLFGVGEVCEQCGDCALDLATLRDIGASPSNARGSRARKADLFRTNYERLQAS
jgi:hypothetical protein